MRKVYKQNEIKVENIKLRQAYPYGATTVITSSLCPTRRHATTELIIEEHNTVTKIVLGTPE